MADFNPAEVNFADLFTYSRASAASTRTPQGLLLNFVDDEPRFTQDGLIIERASTNELLHSRDLTQNSVWEVPVPVAQQPNITRDQVGVDGVASSACLIEDDSDSATASVFQEVASVADADEYSTISFFLKKTVAATTYPAFFFGYEPSAGVSTARIINTNDGSSVVWNLSSDQGIFDVEDWGEWWRVTFSLQNTNVAFTQIQFTIYPAAASDMSGDFDAAATGSCIFDHGQYEVNSDFASSPIETGATSETRVKEDCSILSFDDYWSGGDFTLYGEIKDVVLRQATADNNTTFLALTTASSSKRIELRQDGTGFRMEFLARFDNADTPTKTYDLESADEAFNARFAVKFDSAENRLFVSFFQIGSSTPAVVAELGEASDYGAIDFNRLQIGARFDASNAYRPRRARFGLIEFVNRQLTDTEMTSWCNERELST